MTNDLLQRQIQSYFRGDLEAEDLAAFEQRLANDPVARDAYLQAANIAAALEDLALCEAGVTPSSPTVLPPESSTVVVTSRASAVARVLPWVVALSAVVAFIGVKWSPAVGAQTVARVTGLDGALVWTGDGGSVVRDVAVGMDLSGGTIEGMTPDSWFELEFLDGSKAVIVGNSTLTFSDDGQKRLRLKEGRFSADVRPQPPGRPMIVETRSATFEVVGTRFQVDSGLTSSVLNVSEGKVIAKRKSDGATVAVPAKHRAVSSPKHELAATPIPEFATSWQSDVPAGPYQHLGQGWLYGDWSPETDDTAAQLATIPYTIQDGSPNDGKTLYTVAFGVSSGDRPPVVLTDSSTVRLQARISTEKVIFSGFTLRTASGDFAGRYQVIMPVELLRKQDLINKGLLDVKLPLAFFQLDPSLNEIKERLPGELAGLIVESCWCHTLFDPSALAVESIEIAATDAETESSDLPVQVNTEQQ